MAVLGIILSFLIAIHERRSMPPPPKLEDVIANARRRMSDDTAKARRDLIFNQTEITETLKEDGSVASVKTELFLIYGAEDKFIRLPLEIDGQPVLADPRWMDGFVDETFLDRFSFRWAEKPIASCGERICYVLIFSPKNNPPHNDTHKNKAFNLLRGAIYIEKDTFILRKGMAVLSKPYSKAFGLAGCWRLDIEFEFTEFNGIQVNKSYDIKVHLKEELFSHEQRRHHTITNSGFRYRPSAQ